MQLIRVINKRYHYDKNKGRFTSLAFKPSSNGGISVFCQKCAVEISGTICGHIQNYYSDVSGEPPVYWEFDSKILPSTHVIKESPSASGDECHRDIMNLSKRDAEQVFKKNTNYPDSFKICLPCGGDRSLSIADKETIERE